MWKSNKKQKKTEKIIKICQKSSKSDKNGHFIPPKFPSRKCPISTKPTSLEDLNGFWTFLKSGNVNYHICYIPFEKPKKIDIGPLSGSKTVTFIKTTLFLKRAKNSPFSSFLPFSIIFIIFIKIRRFLTYF